MKKFLFTIYVLVIWSIVILSLHWIDPSLPTHQKISPQQQVEHTVLFLDSDLKDDERCTATVIAPHAILTAEHCEFSKGSKVGNGLRFDQSTRVYTILGEVYDERDHAIYIINGPAFTNILPEESLLDTKVGPGMYTIFGSSSGKSIGTLDTSWSDYSDVDNSQGLHVFDIAVLRGDSGSAIFDKDGKVVGLVTYQRGAKSMSGFALGFSKPVLDYIQTIK